jgi:hypothetical protein
MWFSQAEAQFRRARITAQTTMYDYVLMKLPEDVVMSVRALVPLVSAIEADPVKLEESYTLIKEALLGSYGKTKWQMAYALLDHPELGDRRPSAMMAEMLALRYEATAPDSLFLALFLRRLPSSIRDHLAAANHTTAAEMATHADILWDARNSATVSAVSNRSPLYPSGPPHQTGALQTAVPSLLTAAAALPIATPTAAEAAAPRPGARTVEPPAVERRFATTTKGLAPRLRTARVHAASQKTRSPPWAAQCPRRAHFFAGFNFQETVSG